MSTYMQKAHSEFEEIDSQTGAHNFKPSALVLSRDYASRDNLVNCRPGSYVLSIKDGKPQRVNAAKCVKRHTHYHHCNDYTRSVRCRSQMNMLTKTKVDKNVTMTLFNQTKSHNHGESRTEVAHKHPQYHTYNSRLESFIGWPRYVPKTPEKLASAGFFYTGRTDRVTCFHCGITLRNWEAEDSPVAEHKRYAPMCEFAASKVRVQVVPGDKAQGENFMVIDEIATLQTKSHNRTESRTEVCTVAPKHPKYQTFISRLESFVAWPIRYVPKTPEELASAGFFYIGSADRVTCFQCGITLRDWEEEHDPVAEHRRYSEHCHFINTVSVDHLGVVDRDDNPVFEHQRHSTHCRFIKRLKEQEHRACDQNVGPPSYNANETNGVSQRRAAGAPETNNTVSNFLCLDIRKQLKLIAGLIFSDPVIKQDETPQDVSALEVRVSTLKQSGADSATFLKTTDQNEKDNQESMFPSNANAQNRSTKEPLGLCRLCTKKDVSVTFLPCGHFVACKSCANKVAKCVMCKMDIRERTHAAFNKSEVQ